jgi:hypothetical protein
MTRVRSNVALLQTPTCSLGPASFDAQPARPRAAGLGHAARRVCRPQPGAGRPPRRKRRAGAAARPVRTGQGADHSNSGSGFEFRAGAARHEPQCNRSWQRRSDRRQRWGHERRRSRSGPPGVGATRLPAFKRRRSASGGGHDRHRRSGPALDHDSGPDLDHAGLARGIFGLRHRGHRPWQRDLGYPVW